MSLQTNIVELCEKIKERLVEYVSVSGTQIRWSARNELAHIAGKADLIIRPRRGQDIKSFAQGGQRHGMVCIRVVDITVRTSYALDELGDDHGWFKDHVRFEDEVLNALAGQMLTDDEGYDYLTCPIIYLGTAEESKDSNVRVKNLWGASTQSYELHFKPKLDLAQTT